MSERSVLVSVEPVGVATVTLNRPERGNAYDEDLLHAIVDGLTALAADPSIRVLVLRGAGRHFQTGADIEWLRRAGAYAPEQAFAASMATTRACALLNEFPRPTVAVVHGACFGGGVGLVCCVDVALATDAALFGLTEVRVGVAPTPIATHIVNAMGARHARRYAITGERFGAAEACRIGLVHEVVGAERIESRLAEIIDAIRLGAPGAIGVTKQSLLAANGLTLDARQMAGLAHESWMQRNSAEGQEGTAAHREKRRPHWYGGGEPL